MTAMDAFLLMLKEGGWTKTSDKSLQKNLRKIALYYSPVTGAPTHAARLLENGYWTSKLGDNIDLSHDLSELEGPEYGIVFSVFQKPG
jgi:hypothetical protein